MQRTRPDLVQLMEQEFYANRRRMEQDERERLMARDRAALLWVGSVLAALLGLLGVLLMSY